MIRRLSTLLLSLFLSCELFGQVSLEAGQNILQGDGSGDQQWGPDIVLNARKINGQPGRVAYENQFTDDGFGVAGGRWLQIDYYQDYQGQAINASEQFIINFHTPVTNVILEVGQLDPREGWRRAPNRACNETTGRQKVDESGKYTAYDQNGEVVDSGALLPEESIGGQITGSAGGFKFAIAPGSQPITKIVLEATQWGGDEFGCPRYRNNYPDEPTNDSGNKENNSDFSVAGISYERASTTTNNPPQAVDDSQFEIREDIGLTGIDYATLLRNDTDADGDPLRIVGFDFSGFPGTIENRASREDILFTTATNFNGQIQFSYTITDGQATDVGTVTLTITDVPDDLTIGQDGPFDTDKNTPITIAKSDLLFNDSSIPYLGSPVELVIDAVGDAVNGTVALQDENVVFTPSTNFAGSASFTYTVLVLNDGFGDPRPVDEGVSSAIVVNVLGDDSPQPSINQKAVIVSKVDPNFILQVNNTSNRTSAVVEACDDEGQVWTISDRGNGFHKIINDFANKALEAWQRNPANGDNVTIYKSNNKDWQQWKFIGAGDGYFKIEGKYNPRLITLSNGNAVMLNESGQDEQLWQLVNTSSIDCNEASENSPPVAVLDGDFSAPNPGLTVAEGETLVIPFSLLLANDSDPDGDPLTIISVESSRGGIPTIVGNTVEFAAESLSASVFIYTISDGRGGTASTTVSVSVLPVPPENTFPVAVDDGDFFNDPDFTAVVNEPLVIPFSLLLANDSDPDGDPLTIIAVESQRNGVPAIVGNTVEFTGVDVGPGALFGYTVSDGRGGTASANVALNIIDAPVGQEQVVLDAASIQPSGNTDPVAWGSCVELTAESASGNPTVITLRRGRIGIQGTRFDDQLDYDPATDASEKLTIDFNQSVG